MTSNQYNPLATLICTTLLALCGAAWIPIAAGLEVSNAVALVAIAVGFLAIGRQLVLPSIYVFLFIALVWLYFSMSIRGDGGEEQAFRSLIYVLMAAALAQFARPNLRLSANIGTAVFVALLLVSSVLAGKNLPLGIYEYLVSLNRPAFVYGVIRPSLNSFASGDTEYLASVINTLASAFAVLFIVAATHRAYLAAVVSGVLIVILFSASALLAIFLTMVVLAIRWFVWSPRKHGPALAFAAAAVMAPLLVEPALDYLALNLTADDASRAARVEQYYGALDYIDANPLWGEGIVRIGGHLIHNALLFSWVTAGIVPAILFAAAYIIAIRLLLRAVPGAIFGDLRWCAVVGLVCVFLIRISIGGGGGLPEATAMLALAIAISLERELRELSDPDRPDQRQVASSDLYAEAELSNSALVSE